MPFDKSEQHCKKINGSIVSNVLSSKGKKYHRFVIIGFKN